MVNISQTFVVYHGCRNGYLDGTRKIVPKNRKCIRPNHYPFWKKPINVRNTVETRAQISSKPKATRDYVKRYICYLNVFSKEYFSSDENLTSDNESNTEASGEESIAGNASNTEQNLSSEDKTIHPNTSTTGEDLIIDENTVHEHEHPLSCSCTQTHSTSEIQNPGNKNDTQNPDNKNETNNQALPLTI